MDFKEIESKLKYFKDIKLLWEKYKIDYNFSDDETIKYIEINIKIKFKNNNYGEVSLNHAGISLKDYDGSTLAYFDFTPEPGETLLSEINSYDMEVFGGNP
ncbi:TPA: hypothetical protein IHJ80_004845, partial [Escherichia coli]|nr:hypothetical protein [Escherichia coli]